MRKIPKFHVIFWCGNFVEKCSFCRALGNSPETAETVRFHKILKPEIR